MRFLNILILILLTTGALRSQIVACDIFDLTVNIGNCTSDSTFKLGLDFQVANPTSDSFELWTINNQYLGAYALADLPVSLAQFPAGNNGTGFVRVCILGNPNCCEIKQFLTPDCSLTPVCEIQNLAVTAGACNPDGTFPISIQFTANNATGTEFELWTGAGQYLGAFPLNQLPLTIPNYSGNGAGTDNLKVCIKDNPDCCASTVFDTPICTPTTPDDSCKIRNLRVRALNCTTDNHYALWLNFSAPNTTQTTFSVFTAAGQALGQFPINQLPLVIPNFPWNGQSTDAVTICLGSPIAPDACCRTREFNAPACIGADCAIQELKATPGACTADSTYKLTLRFEAPTADSFELFAENGVFLGIFGVNQLPLVIDSFPGSGEDIDYLKVCIQDSAGYCCRILEFNAPRCRPDDCGVFNYRVETGICADDGTYQLTISFENGINTPIDSFALYSATDSLLGYFGPTDLPLTIPKYPWNGQFYDEIKLCIYFADTVCCTSREILPPNCDTTSCAISNITVETGDCQNGAYPIVLNFDVQNPNNLLFEVWSGNGQYLGVFPLSQLPVTIQNFPASGNNNEVIKICINDAPDCCATFEFPAPDCPPTPCEIFDLSVLTGDCTSDSTYGVKINFQVQNPGNTTTFGVWANGVFFGAYNLSALPLTIQNFPWNGGANDEIKVCLITPGTIQALCCKTLEFPVPDCLTPTGPCEIFNLVVDTGDCTSDSSYVVTLDFDVQNPGGATQFGLWANGVFFGAYNLNALPLTIQNFPWNGGQNDFLKVCLLNANGDPTNCCRVAEFPVPGCLFSAPCEIFDLSVLTGDCTSDSTYGVKINFQVQNPGNTTTFGVWANGVFFGAYNLSALPLTIQNFPWNGGANDEIKVCLITPGTIQALCCKTLEFPVPDCLTPTGPCEIFNLVVDTGDCTSDSSYVVTLDFDVQNPGGATQFGLWANGVFFGAYNLNALPLTIQNFPWNGGQNDFLKVCLLNANGDPTNCCRVAEFPVPGCLFSAPCEIFDLKVIKTPCLCGQFFAIVTFQHSGGGNAGFKIVGNGVNYGNYPYNTPQPIILGPLDGDNMTNYEFAVVDLQQPDCFDEYQLGKVECTMSAVQDPAASGKLTISPNPTSQWLQVQAQISGSAHLGQGDVEILQQDGRLARALTVADAGQFALEVSDLPAGLYRLLVKTAAGRLEGTFVKQ